MALKIPPVDAVKIIAYNQNSDGSLSPAVLTQTGTGPIINPELAERVWFFTLNDDGTLSPFVLT